MINAAVHLTAAALAVLLWPGPVPPLVFAACLALGLAPDLDTPKSLLGQVLPFLSRPLDRAVGHRTATHSLTAVAALAAVAALVVPPWWPLLTLAYASHLIVDLLIGTSGIALFWPLPGWLTLAAWRDDGPAPRLVLTALLCACLLTVAWPIVAPMLVAPSQRVEAVISAPTETPTPTGTTVPSIALSFTLPAGVNLSALLVELGSTIEEGQILARWELAQATPMPTATLPSLGPSPAPPALPVLTGAAPVADQGGMHNAEAAVVALQTAQPAERAALLAAQQRAVADAQRELADSQRDHAAAQRAVAELQPLHERTQAEHQHAVDAALVVLTDAQMMYSLVDLDAEDAAVQQQRAMEPVHAAEVALQAAVDAQDRMRTEQGIERATREQAVRDAEVAIAQAQVDLDALPGQHTAALAQLDADHAAALTVAQGRIAGEQAQVSAAQQRENVAQQRLVATTQARRVEIAATATAQAHDWQEQAEATVQAHGQQVAATVAALPTPAPDRVISRASGKVVGISAEENDGNLVVTLEVVP